MIFKSLNEKVLCLPTFGTTEDKAQLYGYKSWIDYCHKTNIFTRMITKCPCCNKPFSEDNPAIGGHVSVSFENNSEGHPIFDAGYVTPICRRCNTHSWKSFKVFRVMLCRLPKTPPKR